MTKITSFSWIYIMSFSWIFPCGSAGKESACNGGDLGSIPGLRRSPGEGKGYPLQYSGLENSMDCIVHGVAKNRTQLNDFHFPLSLFTFTWTYIAPLVYLFNTWLYHGLPWWLSVKESTCQCRRHEFNPWSRKMPHAMEQLSLCTTIIEPTL